MSSTPSDQTDLMKEVLDTLKNLKMNQDQLASNVDAITGRVNVLAGMKEVRDAAVDPSAIVSKDQVEDAPTTSSVSGGLTHDGAAPDSPSLPSDPVKDGELST